MESQRRDLVVPNVSIGALRRINKDEAGGEDVLTIGLIKGAGDFILINYVKYLQNACSQRVSRVWKDNSQKEDITN